MCLAYPFKGRKIKSSQCVYFLQPWGGGACPHSSLSIFVPSHYGSWQEVDLEDKAMNMMCAASIDGRACSCSTPFIDMILQAPWEKVWAGRLVLMPCYSSPCLVCNTFIHIIFIILDLNGFHCSLKWNYGYYYCLAHTVSHLAAVSAVLTAAKIFFCPLHLYLQSSQATNYHKTFFLQ